MTVTSDLRFFDANCIVGTRPSRHPATPSTLSQYLVDYEYYDLHAGLVRHAIAVHYAPDHGNRRLMAEIAGHPRLVPCWVVMPHHTYEIAPAEDLVAEMLSLNVRAAVMYPKSMGFGTSDDICGPLLSALQEARIPVLFDVTELDIAGAVALCGRYPELPVVLCDVSWGSDRQINALFGKVPNLHLDTWAFQGHRAYERFCELFGSERLLFSTGLPERSPGAARMMAVYEQIDEEARRNIAGGNLLRLLGDVRGAQGEPPTLQPYGERREDPIVEKVRVGAPLSEEFVLDAHAHIAHPGCMGVSSVALAYNDIDGLIGTMDRLGIDITLPSTWSGITIGDPEGNDIVIAASDKYPDRVIPYGCINPNYPDDIPAEFARVFETGLVYGFKPYPPRQHVALTDPRNEPMLRFANDNQRPVLCHMGFSATGSVTPDQVDQLAGKYPGATFLMAHSGQSWAMADAVIPVARKHRNAIAEITYTAILYDFIEYFVRNVNAEQIVFGSDCVMRDAAPQLGWVAWARLPIDQKRLILGGNAARILRLPAERRKPIV